MAFQENSSSYSACFTKSSSLARLAIFPKVHYITLLLKLFSIKVRSQLIKLTSRIWSHRLFSVKLSDLLHSQIYHSILMALIVSIHKVIYKVKWINKKISWPNISWIKIWPCVHAKSGTSLAFDTMLFSKSSFIFPIN